jgi:hypothetical protein
MARRPVARPLLSNDSASSSNGRDISVWFVPRCCIQDKLAVAVSSRTGGVQLWLGSGDSLGFQKKGNTRCWKPLPSSGSEDMTVDTNVCVCVCVCVYERNCKV